MEPEAGLNTQIAPFLKYNLNSFKYFENTLCKENCSFLRRSMEKADWVNAKHYCHKTSRNAISHFTQT